MKISVYIAFVMLSLLTLYASSTPIKFDDAVSTELSKGTLNPRSLGHRVYLDEALFLASNVQKSLDELGLTSSAQTICHDLSNLCQYLKWKRRALTNSIARSLRSKLRSWREQVKSWQSRSGLSPGDDNHIVAKIATCRNIVDKVLAVSRSPLPRAIKRVLKYLEQVLPNNDIPSEGVGSVQALAELQERLRAVTSWEIKGKDIVNAKLITFRDWVEDWNGIESKRKPALDTIKQCEDIMAGNI